MSIPKTPIKSNPIGSPTTFLGFQKSDIPYFVGLAVVLFLIINIRTNFLDIPFERDEGGYVYLGNSLLNGGITFKDILSLRLDGIFYAYAALISIFGYSVKDMHIAFLVLNIGSTIMLFFLTRKLSNNMGGLAAAAFFSVLAMTPNACGFTVQSEHIVAFFSIGGFLALLHFLDNKKIALLILAGTLFSFAFQIKQTAFFYGVFAGVLFVYKCFFVDKIGIKKILLYIIIFVISVVASIIFDLYLVYRNGAWDDFNIWFVDIRKEYTSTVTFEQGLEYLKMVLGAIYENYKFFWVASFLAMITVFFTSIPTWKKLMVVGLMLSGYLTVTPGYHYYGHYFLQWIPAVSICGAIFVFSIQDLLQKKFKLTTAATVIALGLIVLPVYSNLNKMHNYYFRPNYTQILRAVYGNNPFPETKVIADKLNSIMKEDDQMVMFGTEVQLYVYTNKKSPTRFVGSGALLQFDIPQAKAWQQEFISDIEKAKPKYLVFYSHAISWLANPKVENLIFPWFDKFSAEKYNLIGFADMNDNMTNYVWAPDMDLVNNPPKSQYRIFIFERKQNSLDSLKK